MRIFVASDLHTDFKQNYAKLERLLDWEYANDALIVAGDIAHQVEVIEETLRLLKSAFGEVFYVPGNHDLWVRNGHPDSIAKFRHIQQLCHRHGVRTAPAKIGDVWIVPLLSWYEASFDSENNADPDALKGWNDFHWCKWPKQLNGDITTYFLQQNQASVRQYDAPVISFSHFLPRLDLLPTVAELHFKGLPKVAGCHGLEAQIRQIPSTIHVFGHSHINYDGVIDGIRYVQNALSYPRDKKRNANFGFKRV